MKGMGTEGTWIEIRLPKADEPAQLVFHDSDGVASTPDSLENGFVVIRWWDQTDKPECPTCGYNPTKKVSGTVSA